MQLLLGQMISLIIDFPVETKHLYEDIFNFHLF